MKKLFYKRKRSFRNARKIQVIITVLTLILFAIAAGAPDAIGGIGMEMYNEHQVKVSLPEIAYLMSRHEFSSGATILNSPDAVGGIGMD